MGRKSNIIKKHNARRNHKVKISLYKEKPKLDNLIPKVSVTPTMFHVNAGIFFSLKHGSLCLLRKEILWNGIQIKVNLEKAI